MMIMKSNVTVRNSNFYLVALVYLSESHTDDSMRKGCGITFPVVLYTSITPLLISPLELNLFLSMCPAGHDFCSEGHSCMEHSDCVNLEAGDCCVCKDGFRPLRDDNAYCEGKAWLWITNQTLTLSWSLFPLERGYVVGFCECTLH